MGDVGAGRRAGRALARAREEAERRAGALARRARAAALGARERIEGSRARAGPGGWWPARVVAAAAGAFLLWRFLFGRGLARIPAGVAGVVVLSAVLSPAPGERGGRIARRARAAADEGAKAAVVEVKSPAELEKGVAPGAREQPSPGGLERGPRAEPPSGNGRGDGSG